MQDNGGDDMPLTMPLMPFFLTELLDGGLRFEFPVQRPHLSPCLASLPDSLLDSDSDIGSALTVGID